MAEQNCSTCEYCKFDELWGEYKCIKHSHRCGLAEIYTGCPSWEKKQND